MVAPRKLRYVEQPEEELLRLDLGAGKGLRTPPGYVPVDKHGWKDITVVDLGHDRWPWTTASVDEAHSDYLLHYLNAGERVHFMNELHRVLKPQAKALIIVPYWCSGRAYVDLRCQWPPIAEGFFTMLSKEFRGAQNWIDDFGLTCDFEATIGYGLHEMLRSRNQEYVTNAAMFHKDAIVDVHVTLTKR